MPPDSLKGPIMPLKNFLGHSAFKIELDLWSEASTKEILSNKCLLLQEYKQFKKKTHCILATDNSVSHLFTNYKNFHSIIKLGFHHIFVQQYGNEEPSLLCHLFCEPMRSMAVENGKPMSFKTGTGGRNGGPRIN